MSNLSPDAQRRLDAFCEKIDSVYEEWQHDCRSQRQSLNTRTTLIVLILAVALCIAVACGGAVG